MNSKLNMGLPINYFFNHCRPPPCTAWCVLSCANTLVILFHLQSLSIDVLMQLLEKKITLSGFIHSYVLDPNVHTFSHQNFLKNNPLPIGHMILMNRIRLLHYYCRCRFGDLLEPLSYEVL